MTALRPRRTARFLTLALGALLAIAACTTGSGTTAVPPSAQPIAALPTTPVPIPVGSVSPAGSAHTVAVTDAPGIGKFLTGEGGKTLYTLASDGPDKSTCSGACVASWPPFTLGAGETVVAGAGVSKKFATFTRPDGTAQVSYNGNPLYYFAGDTKAGDTNGQGLKGVWFVASPDAKARSGPTY